MREKREREELNKSSGLVPDSDIEQGITKEDFERTLKKVSRPEKPLSDEEKKET